ncbi:Protein of unknown function [Pyronema omphalodes CBS 100304]|uniref:Uncharacterized protein n=1 Tax=Pyronema omphalodes (strain CBS 100304) TaxID=1076935 RepID=U4L2D6_PYROM|nr:Protein of unknown function [Pyronema omphalodes CBS 100304]
MLIFDFIALIGTKVPERKSQLRFGAFNIYIYLAVDPAKEE